MGADGNTTFLPKKKKKPGYQSSWKAQMAYIFLPTDVSTTGHALFYINRIIWLEIIGDITIRLNYHPEV